MPMLVQKLPKRQAKLIEIPSEFRDQLLGDLVPMVNTSAIKNDKSDYSKESIQKIEQIMSNLVQYLDF